MSATTSTLDKADDNDEDVDPEFLNVDEQPLLHEDRETPRKRSRRWYDLWLYYISSTVTLNGPIGLSNHYWAITGTICVW